MTACLDWEQRIVNRLTLLPNPPLFPHEAEEALDVFNALKMVDAVGSPYMGDVCDQWVKDFVSQIFGSYCAKTGVRHITEYLLLISKKNGKSTIAAGIMMTALILNWRQSAEFIILSPTVEIANNSFKPAADMVRNDEELSELFHVQDHIRTITHRVTGATLKVVAADSDTVGGKKAVGVLVDELWLLGKNSKSEDMLREATGGLASRPEGFVIYLTTQSNEPPAGVFKKKLDYARRVRDGEVVDPRFLPLLYEFPKHMLESEAYLLPENFYITNPSIGSSVDENFLLRQFQIERDAGDESLRGFLAKHLNVEIGMNLRSDRWPGGDFWLQAAKMGCNSLQELLGNCEVITVGIDGGGLDDLLGFAAVGRHKTENKWLSFTHALAHPSVLDRRKSIASVLEDFKQQGDVTFVDSVGEDTEIVAAWVAEIYEAGLLHEVGMDPAAVGGILDSIEAAGVPSEKVVSVNQGWRLAGAIKTTERKLAEGVLIHAGTSLMKWCVGNAKVKVVGNAIVVTKQMSGTAKIDPLMALFNAVHLMSLNPAAPASNKSFWES